MPSYQKKEKGNVKGIFFKSLSHLPSSKTIARKSFGEKSKFC
jgi:hypothetical protein